MVFAVGRRPTLSLYDAGLLARFLELAGFPAMSELRARSATTFGAATIRLDRDELTALAHLFSEAPELLTAREFAAFRRLNDEVVAGLEI